MIIRPRAAYLPLALLIPLAAGCGAADPGGPESSGGVARQPADLSVESAKCTGVNVPGDYATIQDAVTALQSSVGGTICLRSSSYSESPVINAYGAAAPLTIRGAGRGKTTIAGTLSAASYPDTLTLEDLTLSDYTTVEGRVSLKSVDLRTTSSQPALYVMACVSPSCSYDSAVTVDAADIEGSKSEAAVEVWISEAFSTTAVSLTVTNSWIHDSWRGIWLPVSTSGQDVTLDVVNNTFEDDASALETDEATSLSYFNNIFSGNTTAVTLTYSGTAIGFSNNAYYGNTTNFAGYAIEGKSDVKAALRLTKAQPPALGASSPCRGAALASVATKDDFHGKIRDTSAVDIGAVQSSP